MLALPNEKKIIKILFADLSKVLVQHNKSSYLSVKQNPGTFHKTPGISNLKFSYRENYCNKTNYENIIS